MASQVRPRDGNTHSLLYPGAFDTHVHVFDPELGPYAAGRAYTPEDAPLKKLIAFNQILSSNPSSNTLVLVQPSPYNNDCSVLIQCLQKLKNQNIKAFGIAVLDLDNTTDAQLNEMHDLGIRGIRLNFQADGKEVSTDNLVAALHRTADRIRYLQGWMIQLFVPGWIWDNLHDIILELPVKIIADHLGGLRGSSKLSSDFKSVPMSQPGFKSLLSLAKQSRVVVKISGLYRVSSDTSSTYSDLQSIIETFAREIPDQVIWGSDWPHTGEGQNRLERRLDVKEPFRTIDNFAILDRLYDWMGSGGYQKMLVDNPRRLYPS
ncbi:amidohydrolase 2 [Aspergillus pseudotamarii]|uniref:Amidohydrolase 2 n=1 Tax=Aspergillus pseudotamarii TaxID=132259 RepID=A0A5N6SZM7_ASPPS|nr:amidohydrolase 2 [Aspergillus pseudotamarii]KAE8138893.1 amidohydrolase 2 [Aspergillus pseudotamarii]